MRAHQASQTAVKIGRVVLYVAADPRRAPLLPMGAAETTEALLRAAGLLEGWQARAYHSSGVRSMLGWTEHQLQPGFTTHIALRKRVLDDEVRAAIDAGAVQVLVVGAGFDTLALRLARAHRHVRFVEIDHPATQALKRHALDQLDPPANLRLHPADLAVTSLPEALDELGWDRRARGVVVAEGVLMYLGEHEVADFLRGLASRLAPASRLLATYLVTDDHGRPRLGGRLSGLTRASLRVIGEPLRWSTTAEALHALLAETGFTVRDDPGRVDLRLRYLVPAGLDDLPLTSNERLVIATTSTP